MGQARQLPPAVEDRHPDTGADKCLEQTVGLTDPKFAHANRLGEESTIGRTGGGNVGGEAQRESISKR
jgi:hypothetical protein